MRKYFNNETKLNYNLNRDYNPNWGRYMQTDPIGLNAGMNTYGYSGDNSLNYVDYLGLYVSIIFVNDLLPGQINHLAININGTVYSFYPDANITKNSIITGSNLPGLVDKVSLNDFANRYNKINIYLDEYQILTNNKNEKMLQEYLEKLYHNQNLYYSIQGLQCTTFVQQALVSSGIKLPNQISALTPSQFENLVFKNSFTTKRLFKQVY